MKLILGFLLSVLPAGLAQAQAPALLAEAIKRTYDATPGWAFTQTRTKMNKDGTPGPQTIVEIDPSKPYAEQYRPILIDGKEPTAKQRAAYVRRGEKAAERRAKEAEKAEGQTIVETLPKPKLNFGAGSLVVDLDNATVVAETNDLVTYTIPLVAEGKTSIPVEKLRLTATVAKAGPDFREATMEVLEPFRQKLVAKIKRGKLTFRFSTPDPAYPAVITHVQTDFAFSLFFRTRTGTSEVVGTHFRRVKPYDDRFKASAGTATIFGF